MLRIGEFSKLGKVTVKALRYYDEVGLLKPHFISEENGYRYYKPDQLNTVSDILSLKEMGLSLDEISFLISQKPSAEEIQELLLGKRTQVISNIDSEKTKLAKINAYIKSIEEDKKMENITIKELPQVIVASMRTVIPTYDALYKIAPAMGEKMKVHGAVCREPFYCFNIYHDEEYKDKDIDLEICEAVNEKLPNADGIVYKEIPGVKEAACIYHKGAYDELSKSYATMFKWLEENNYSPIDKVRESYIDGPWNKENPADWLTEIQIPVAKK